MMQARNHDYDGDGESPMKWYEISASVGHLVLAIVLAVATAGTVVFGYIWDNHKAITLLQERQSVVLKYIAEDVTATAERDRQTGRALAEIAHAVEELKIEVVRHMAASQASSDYANGLRRRP